MGKRKSKITKILLAGMMALILSVSSPLFVWAEETENNNSVSTLATSETELTVSSIRADSGNTVDITLSASSITDLGAIEYQLVYDPAKLTCNSVKPASFDGVSSLNQEKGRISYAAASSKKLSFQKDTVLMTLNFTISSQAVDGEKIEIYLENTKLYHSGGTQMSLSVKNGYVQVSKNGNTPQVDGSYLTGIVPGSTVYEVNAKLGQNAVWKDAQGIALTNNDKVKTGDKVTFGGKTYQAVIYGDINGDGSISSLDVVKARNHILGRSVLTGANLKAADCNKDGKINSIDVVKMRNHILNRADIVQ